MRSNGPGPPGRWLRKGECAIPCGKQGGPVTAIDNLREAVRVLSLPAPLQEDYLVGIGHFRGAIRRDLDWNVDELALQFEDAMLATRADIGSRLPEIADCIRAVDGKLAEMTQRGDRSLWTLRAIFLSEDWSEVRRLGARAFEMLNSGDTAPT